MATFPVVTDDDSTDEEKSAAIMAALRHDSQWAQLAQLTGDPVLSSYGRGQMSNITEQEKMLAAAKQSRLDRVLRARQIAQEGQSAAWTHEHQQGELAHGSAELAQTTAHNRAEEAQARAGLAQTGAYQNNEIALKKQGLEQSKYAQGRPGDFLFDTRTGQQVPGSTIQGKSVEPAIVQRVQGMNQSLDHVDQLEKDHAAIGLSGYLGDFGANADYKQDISKFGPEILQSTSTKGTSKGKPEDGFPKGRQQHDPAQFEVMRSAIRKQRDDYIKTLVAAGVYNPAELQALAESRQASSGAASSPNAGSSTHYKISPDRKRRVPIDQGGNEIGPEEANPNG